MNAYTSMLSTDITAAVTERETRLAAVITKYDLRPVNVPPFLACTARDMAVIVDKMERKCVMQMTDEQWLDECARHAAAVDANRGGAPIGWMVRGGEKRDEAVAEFGQSAFDKRYAVHRDREEAEVAKALGQPVLDWRAE